MQSKNENKISNQNNVKQSGIKGKEIKWKPSEMRTEADAKRALMRRVRLMRIGELNSIPPTSSLLKNPKNGPKILSSHKKS